MGTTCQNSTQIHLQRETASVMLGSTSICMYHLETEHLLLFVSNRNVSIDVSVLSHGLPNLVESTAPALLHRHFILARASLWTVQQNNSWSHSLTKLARGAGLQNSVPPIRKNHPCFLVDYTTFILLLSCLFRRWERKDRGQRATQPCRCFYLPDFQVQALC